MTQGTDLKTRWALITGASSGLGVDFATNLAARGCNVVLVARRQERLALLQEQLQTGYGVKVHTVPLDLTAPDSPQVLYEHLAQTGIAVDILINNAGAGHLSNFLEFPWQDSRSMIELNVVALTHLTRLFAQDMVHRGFGRILWVASTGAYQPVPTMAVYGATKAFVLSFGEALGFELRGTGVTCTVLSPGFTATEFFEVGGQRPNRVNRWMMMSSRQVSGIGVRAMLQGRSSVVAGFWNALTAWSIRFTPRCLNIRMVSRVMKQQSGPQLPA